MKIFTLITVGSFAATFCVEAQYTEVSLGTNINANLQTLYAFGSNYQVGNSTLTVAGVPFDLALFNNTAGTTGVVQSPDGNFNDSGPFSFTFAVPAGTHATALYSLMNSAFGESGVQEASLVVTGTGGESATLNLIEGNNIRDHNNDGFVNSLTDSTVVPTYFLNGAPTTPNISVQTRLDRQVLDLPASFSGDTIASVTFEGTAQGDPNGSAFLAGLTLSVPECSSFDLLLVGLGCLLFHGVRRVVVS